MSGASPPPVTPADAAAEGRSADEFAIGGLDRCNPILIREVQQALGGKLFTGSLWVSLLIVVGFALWVAVQGDEVAGRGLEFFARGISVMAPVLLFVVPIQAFMAMRSEMQPGTAEQLFLSRLRPGRIVRGKAMAAMVQYAVYVAVFAPLLATLYLLQGVDLPTIALALMFSFLFCLGTTMAAIAAAAVARVGPLQPLAYAAVAFNLGMLSMSMIAGGPMLVRAMASLRRLDQFWDVIFSVLLGFGFACWLLGMVAASHLTHENENRSSGFRVFVVALAMVVFPWACHMVPRRFWDQVMPAAAAIPAIALGVVGWFAVAERRGLSPRTRVHVPRSKMAALLLAPWLPGSGRGLLFVLVVGAMVFAVPLVGFRPAGGVSGPAFYTHNGLALGGLYGVSLLSLACVIRGWLGNRRWSNPAGLVAVSLLVIIGCALPAILDLIRQGDVRGWHWGHLSNPFWTLEHHLGRSSGRGGMVRVVWPMIGVASACVLLATPAMIGGVREVLAASRERRARVRGEA